MGAIIKAHAPDMDAAQRAFGEKFRSLAAGMPPVPASRVVDHIEHIAKVAGADHVCLGSDFDGIPTGPAGLDDVSKFPYVTEELLRRGFSTDDVKKILGENVLRVLEANERGRTAASSGPAN
jgi:membrane dipeptidase